MLPLCYFRFRGQVNQTMKAAMASATAIST
jgi:hypothetical protein